MIRAAMVETATEIKTFRVPMFFTRRASRAAVVELEKAALEKLLQDIVEAKLDPLPSTFRTEWSDSLNGTAYLAGARK